MMSYLKKYQKIIFISIFLISILFVSQINAEDPSYNLEGAGDFLKTVGSGIGYETGENATPENLIGNIIQIILSFLGIIFLILIIVGGYQWMTAGGNEETIGKAKKRIINATIGVAIVLMAYIITYFILNMLIEQTITPPAVE